MSCVSFFPGSAASASSCSSSGLGRKHSSPSPCLLLRPLVWSFSSGLSPGSRSNVSLCLLLPYPDLKLMIFLGGLCCRSCDVCSAPGHGLLQQEWTDFILGQSRFVCNNRGIFKGVFLPVSHGVFVEAPFCGLHSPVRGALRVRSLKAPYAAPGSTRRLN